MQTVSLAEVKAKLSSYVGAVHGQRDRVTITRNGRPVAVLISVDELESLEETLEILGDPEELAALEEGIADANRGNTVPLETVIATLRQVTG